MKKNTILVIFLAVSFIAFSSVLTILAIKLDENSKLNNVEQIVLDQAEAKTETKTENSNEDAFTANNLDYNQSKDLQGNYNITVQDGVDDSDCNISYEQAVSLGLKAIEKKTGIDCSYADVKVSRYDTNESVIWNCVAEDGKNRFEFRVNANSGKILSSNQYELENSSDYVWILKSEGDTVEKKIDQQQIQAYKSLRIKTDSDMNVEVQEGKDYSINAKYYGEDYQVSYTIENGVMQIETEGDSDSVDNGSNTLTLTIPSGVTLEKVNASLNYGNFTMEKVLADSIDVDLECGTLTMNDVTTKDSTLNISTGDAEITNYVSTKNSIDIAAGNIQMDNCTSKICKITLAIGDAKLKGKFSGYTECTADLGSVELHCTDTAEKYNYKLMTDLGIVSVNGKDSETSLSSNNKASNSINVRTGMGEAELDFE